MANYFFTNTVATNAILFHNGKMLYNHWFLCSIILCTFCDQKDHGENIKKKKKTQNFVPLISKIFQWDSGEKSSGSITF